MCIGANRRLPLASLSAVPVSSWLYINVPVLVSCSHHNRLIAYLRIGRDVAHHNRIFTNS